MILYRLWRLPSGTRTGQKSRLSLKKNSGDATVTVLLTMLHRLEYAPVWLLVRILGALPHSMARAAAIGLAWTIYLLHGRLRSVGMRNLQIAFPEKILAERRKILRGEFKSLGRQLAEVCRFPSYTRENVSQTVIYDGFENYEVAKKRG